MAPRAMARCFSTHVNQLSIPETMKQNLLGMGIQKLFDIQVRKKTRNTLVSWPR